MTTSANQKAQAEVSGRPQSGERAAPCEFSQLGGGALALARGVLVRLVSLFLAASFLITPAWAQMTLAPSSLPDAAVGTPYSQSFFILGGTAPYHVSLAGRLPVGMTFANEMIAGTPTESGIFSFSVFASDSVGGSDTRGYTLSVRPPTISVSPGSLPDGAVGSAYSQSLSAFGGTAPYSFSVSGTLPPGITMDPTGLLSGTPSSPGSYTFSAIVTDSTTGDGPYVKSFPYTLEIAPGSLSFSPAVPDAVLGQAYAHALSVTGGTAPYTFMLFAGALPEGLSLGTDGLISGTPREEGMLHFVVFAQDSTSGTPINGSRTYSMSVARPTITLTPASLPDAQVGTGYSTLITASGGTAPYTYSAVGLPPGLTLDVASGAISGTPSIAGSFNVVANATDAYQSAGSNTFVMHVAEALAISPPAGAVPSATVGTPYSLTISGSGGATPYSYGISSGALPDGLGLDPTTGAIAGTPKTSGAYHFDVTLTDANNGAVTAAYVLTVRQIGAALAVDPPSGALPGGQVGTAYGQSFTASGGSGNYTYALSGNMPAGLTLDAVTGILSGTPAVASDFTFTITATDTLDPANADSATYTLAIAAGGLSLSPTVPDATLGQAYAHTLSATGGTAPYTFALFAGALPEGLSLGPDGLISGTPREESMLHFVVFAQDSTSGTPINGSRTYSMSVAPPTITLTPASLPNAQVGAGYSAVIAASGGTAPYTYSATGLPAGLTLDTSSGAVSGTPTTAGTVSFTVTATDTNGATGSAAHMLAVIDAAAPTVLSTGVVGSPTPDATSVTFEVVFSEPVTGFSASDLVLTTTGSATGTISALSTDDNITYRSSVTAISGIGSLRLDVAAGGSIIDGNGNSLAAAFTSGTAWTRGGSSNAQLSGLAPSTSALSPAFGAGARTYTLAVPNSVETLALTPTAADPSATITVNGQTVASGTASPAITLNIGATTIVVVVTAPDGSTTQTYTVTVDRPAPTVIDLTPAAGALPGATMGAAYNQTLAASGGSSPYSYAVTAGALPAGMTLAADGTLSGTPTTAGTASFTVTATDANGANGSAAYTLEIRTAAASAHAELAGLLPGAGSLQPGFNTGTLDYTVSVGNEVETIAVTPTTADANASITVNGQPVASGTVSRPIALSVGSNLVRIVVTAEDGATTRTYTVTVARAVIIRPDPSQDPEVMGLLNAQANTARRFAQHQITNFQRRLEQLHDQGERAASSMGVRLGLTQNPSNTAAQQIDQMIASSHGAALNARPSQPGAAASMPGVLAYSPDGTLPAAGATEGMGTSPDSSFAGPGLGGLVVWSGGFVNFGARDNGGLDLDHTMAGVSGGLDYRFSEQLIGGLGVGYGRDRTDIGQNGTASGADAYSAAIYGSYRPIDNLFIDALIGGGWMNFASTRYVTANGEFATGSRDGTQLFGALTAAYEFGDEVWLISPYGRVEFSRSWLDGFSETGGGIHGITYGEQTIDTLSGVLGIRANYAFQMDWGTLTPGVRAEYTYDFEGSSQASLGYTDLGAPPYFINLAPTVRDHLTLGLSLDFQFDIDWNLGLDYHTRIGGSKGQDHAFGAKLGMRF